MEGEAIKDKMLRCKTWPFPHSSTQCFKFSRKNLIFNLASNPLLFWLFLQISYTNLVPSARPAGEDVSSLRYSHFFFKTMCSRVPKVFYTFHFKGAVKHHILFTSAGFLLGNMYVHIQDLVQLVFLCILLFSSYKAMNDSSIHNFFFI